MKKHKYFHFEKNCFLFYDILYSKRYMFLLCFTFIMESAVSVVFNMILCKTLLILWFCLSLFSYRCNWYFYIYKAKLQHTLNIGAIEVSIATMLKEDRSRTEEVYVCGFVPSYLLPNRRPNSLDPFLCPLIEEVEEYFTEGVLLYHCTRYQQWSLYKLDAPLGCTPAWHVAIMLYIFCAYVDGCICTFQPSCALCREYCENTLWCDTYIM